MAGSFLRGLILGLGLCDLVATICPELRNTYVTQFTFES